MRRGRKGFRIGATIALVLAIGGCGSPAVLPSATLSPIAPTATPPVPITPTPAAWPITGPGGCAVPPPAVSAPTSMALVACYQISGAVTASGGFIDELEGQFTSTTCAEWVQEGNTDPDGGEELTVPNPGNADVRIGSEILSFELNVSHYHGPSTYSPTYPDQLIMLSGGPVWAFAPFGMPTSATLTVRVAPDGSGSLAASDFVLVSAGSTQTESMTESWVCVPNHAQ